MFTHKHGNDYPSFLSGRSRVHAGVRRVPALGALFFLALGCGAADVDSEGLGQSQAPLTFNAINRESFTNGGVQGNDISLLPNVSVDGRFVTFFSRASNLVGNDANGVDDVFVRDRQSGTISLVSVSSAGVQGNAASGRSQPSGDGRFVVFDSLASNLVTGDTNAALDVFVLDRQNGQTTRVSVSSAGVQGNSGSFGPSISADGRFVAFTSLANNLVAGDTNGQSDVFLYDRVTAQTQRVSVSSAGVQGNSFSDTGSIQGSVLSADGSVVVFQSSASNLVAGDNNASGDVFARVVATGQTVRVSVSSAGAQGNTESRSPSISGNGNFVVFSSGANTLAPNDGNNTFDIFVRNLSANTTTLASVSSAGVLGNDFSEGSDISDDGRFVGFTSFANNLVASDTNGVADVFERDLVTGSTIRVSVGNAGTQANQSSGFEVSLSGNGRLVAFPSLASNLVAADTNSTDVFLASTTP